MQKMSSFATQHTDRRGVALVQGVVHEAEWIFREHKEVDHGVDAHIESIVDDKVTGRMIALQIKTGSSWFEEVDDEGYVYRGVKRHLEYWLEHSLPVVLLLVNLESSKVYWTHITEEKVIRTGKGWKITVPRSRCLDASALESLGRVAVNLKISRPYSQLSLDDVSHAGAKRYLATVLLNGDFPRDYTESLGRELTKQISLETWTKNPRLKSHFGDRSPDVIWLHICRTVDDSAQCNWLCRTEWISPTLDKQFRPMREDRSIPIGEVGFIWSSTRGVMERFALDRELTKGEAAELFESGVALADSIVEKNRKFLEAFLDKPVPRHPSLSALEAASSEAREHYLSAGDLGYAPLELSELMQRFQSVLASLDNTFTVFTETLNEDESIRRAAFLARRYLEAYDQDRSRYDEEARRRGLKA